MKSKINFGASILLVLFFQTTAQGSPYKGVFRDFMITECGQKYCVEASGKEAFTSQFSRSLSAGAATVKIFNTEQKLLETHSCEAFNFFPKSSFFYCEYIQNQQTYRVSVDLQNSRVKAY